MIKRTTTLSCLPHIATTANLKDRWLFKEVIQSKNQTKPKKHIFIATKFLKVIQIS